MICAFTVDGKPASRGSKRAVRTKSGKINLIDNAASYVYMDAIRLKAKVAMAGRLPVDGPVVLYWVARFTRPKSHYRRSGELRPDAPVYHTNVPDCSKVVRGVEDAMAKIVYADDRQIVSYAPGHGKQWTCGPSHTEIALFAVK